MLLFIRFISTIGSFYLVVVCLFGNKWDMISSNLDDFNLSFFIFLFLNWLSTTTSSSAPYIWLLSALLNWLSVYSRIWIIFSIYIHCRQNIDCIRWWQRSQKECNYQSSVGFDHTNSDKRFAILMCGVCVQTDLKRTKYQNKMCD